jgi:hypothetical protein
MATKITVALEDDLDGGPADETVRFEVGGTEYEIDLNKKNARAFRKQLAPFVEHARRAGRGQRRPRTSPRRQRTGDLSPGSCARRISGSAETAYCYEEEPDGQSDQCKLLVQTGYMIRDR